MFHRRQLCVVCLTTFFSLAPVAWAQSNQSDTTGRPDQGTSQNQTQMSTGQTSQTDQSQTQSQAGMTQSGDINWTDAHYSKGEIQMVQQALKDKGFDPGPVNGRMTKKTKNALRDYQKQNNLTVVGDINNDTLKALGIWQGAIEQRASSTTSQGTLTGESSTSATGTAQSTTGQSTTSGTSTTGQSSTTGQTSDTSGQSSTTSGQSSTTGQTSDTTGQSSTTSSQSSMPGQSSSTPSQSSSTPGQSSTSGQTYPSGQSSTSGQTSDTSGQSSTTSGQSSTTGQSSSTPGQSSTSGQTYPSGQSSTSGQSTTGTTGSSTDQSTMSGQSSTTSGQSSTTSGQTTTTGTPTTGQTETATSSAATGKAADQAELARKSAEVLRDLTQTPDKSIPNELLERAKGIAVIPHVIKGAFGIGGQWGEGMMLGRDASGNWSNNPCYIQIGGASIGFQAGVEATDLVLVFTSKDSIDALLNGKLKLGADAGVAAGPVGRQASASTDVKMSGPIYSYSRNKGVFAGVSLSGAVISIDDSANEKVYGQGTTGTQLLKGEMPAQANAQAASIVQPFVEAVRTNTGAKAE